MSLCFFFFKQKTAYEMRISDWSSDVCSSDLRRGQQAAGVAAQVQHQPAQPVAGTGLQALEGRFEVCGGVGLERADADVGIAGFEHAAAHAGQLDGAAGDADLQRPGLALAHDGQLDRAARLAAQRARSEEHTSELPSLMRTSYAVFCL